MQTETASIMHAPAGKFRVVEIDEDEQRFSSFEPDYTEVIKDCETIEEAKELAQKVEHPNRLRLVCDENRDYLGQFRLGRVAQ